MPNVTVHGHFEDPQGRPLGGDIELLLASYAAGDGTITAPLAQRKVLSKTGDVSILVLATDDPSMPPNAYYTITYHLVGSRGSLVTTFEVELPGNVPSVDLMTITPMTVIEKIEAYLTKVQADLLYQPLSSAVTLPITEANVTGLVGHLSTLTTAVGLRALAASPTFTGTITAPAGSISMPTISGLSSALSAKADLVNGFVPTSQIPAFAINKPFTAVSQTAMLGLTDAEPGSLCIRTDQNRTWVLADLPASLLANWVQLPDMNSVTSVNGQQGIVVLDASNVGAATVVALNTEIANRGTAEAAINVAIGLKANQSSLNSHTGTGTNVHNVGSTSDVVGTNTVQVLGNKRIVKRPLVLPSTATPAINTDDVDYVSIPALTTPITSFTTNLTGTPTVDQTLWVSITSTASQAITWGAMFESSTVLLPTATVAGVRLDVGFVWNDITSKWRCVSVA